MKPLKLLTPAATHNISFLPKEERIAIGKQFERDADRFLVAQGFPIGRYESKEKQWEFGESAAHVEIKFDNCIEKYASKPGGPTLYIELREKCADGTWRGSGPHDASNPWFYLTGDYQKLWLFACPHLIRMEFSKNYEIKPNAAGTAEGMIVPLPRADVVAARLFTEPWVAWVEETYKGNVPTFPK